jgi:uncharacterized protein YlxW (UPF0749 family)
VAEGTRSHRGLSGWIFSDEIDPGYRVAAQRRGGAPAWGPVQLTWLVAGTLLVGVLLGIAARNAAALAPGTHEASRGLAAEVAQARARTDELGRRAEELRRQVAAERSAALSGDAAGRQVLDQVARLEMADAAVPVTGPGLRITIADPPARAGSSLQRDQTVLDRDLQTLVNDLWSSGAEAIALGGVRLHPLATVRQAGGAMLVDNRPVGQPYRFEVIGDQATLQTNLVNTDGYGRFRAFQQIYHTEFTLEPVDQLALPAGSAATRLAVPAAAPVPTTEGGR